MLDIPLFDRFSTRAIALWSACAAAMYGAIVWSCQGHFLFALDDPYIHLSVAHNLIAGNYGINAHEASSPSSSIAWPWILTLTEALHLGAYGPLGLDLAAAAGTLLVGLRLLRATNVIDVAVAPRPAAGTAAALVLVVSAIGLPFTGLEHSAHVFCSVLTVEALALACAGRSLSFVHIVALAALPLLRFEGLALFVAGVAALAWVGRRREAGVAAALGLLGLALYGTFAWRLGLPWLPSSVLVKSNVTTTLGVGPSAFFTAMGWKLISDVLWGRAPALLTLFALLAWIVTRPAARARAPLYLAVATALGAHMAFGAYGWFGRYEVYAVAIGALATLVGLADVFARPGRPLFENPSEPEAAKAARSIFKPRPGFAAMGMLLVLGAPYAGTALLTPAAAANVYGMQYQLRRLAQDFYPHPVAVNDIGLVSWDNTHYVLDLWGLGSEAARKLRKAHELGPAAMERLARLSDVEMVMIYDTWFSGVPSSWRKIAVIDVAHEIVTGPEVSVYLTPQGDPTAAASALARLRATLPPGTSLNLLPEAGLASEATPRSAGANPS